MATLTGITGATRKILEFLAIGITAIILLVVVFQVGMVVKQIFAPTPPPAPTVSYGKLPAITFPQSIGNQTYTYTINTLTGSLPTLPDRINVYKLTQPAPSLLGLDQAKNIAKAAKFTVDPTQLSDTTYRWTNTDPFPMALTMDIQSYDFVMTGNYMQNKAVTDATYLPDETLAQTVAKSFFDGVMPLPNYIDQNKTKTTLWAISNGTLVPASSLSSSQLIRVDYFPQNVDKLPVYTANPDDSLIYALVASSDTNYPQVVEAQYYHKQVSSDKATYPIIDSNTALNELKQGKGYVAANPTNASNITITNVSLGYYIQPTPQQYLWPIIVFQGDQGFYAYVSAIKDEWVQK